jgi:MaoC like domain/short chain dehydrogenase
VSTPSRIFTADDQAAFAALSGDFNPLHVDALAARRGLAGGAVVHGIHLLLWALAQWSGKRAAPIVIDQLDVVFAKPVVLGAEVSLAFNDTEDGAGAGRAGISLHAGGVEVAAIDFGWHEGRMAATELPGAPPRMACKDLNAADLPGRSGSLPLHYDRAGMPRLFASLAEVVPPVQLASLLATSRLVGVECPGLHSLYAELHLAAVDDTAAGDLHYSVKRFDARFNLLTMLLEVPGLRGSIKAFLRPVPVQQPSCASMRAEVDGARFARQRALVVGGSRGLGEVFAKVLAMGGADVVLTYHSGAAEAQAVVADISGQGGRARSLALDVTAPDSAAALGDWRPTHLYYMATPFIFVGQRGVYSPTFFARFCAYYVDGFASLFESVRSPELAGVFYPSSVSLNEKPLDMCEYVAAKSAGEALFAMMQKAHPTVRFVQSRLPRLATDQTISLMPVSNLAPLPVLLALLEPFAQHSSVETL